MIDINLVPSHLRKKNSLMAEMPLNLPKEIFLGVGGVLIALLLLVHVVLGIIWLLKVAPQVGYRIEWQQVLPDKKNIDAIGNEAKDLKNKMATITDMTVKRSLSWSMKLNAISDALPKGVWFKRITLQDTTLVLEGSAVSKQKNEIAVVGNFVNTLKKNESFMKDFASLEVNSIQRGKQHNVDIVDFTIAAKLK